MSRHNEDVAAGNYLATEFKPATGLRYLTLFFAYGLAMSVLYMGVGVGLPCPLRRATGWQCPLCGATRMGSSLLQLDVVTAWRYNPVVLVGITVLGVLGVLWTVQVLGGPAVRFPERLRIPLRRVHPTRWLVLSMTTATIYTLLRNLI